MGVFAHPTPPSGVEPVTTASSPVTRRTVLHLAAVSTVLLTARVAGAVDVPA